MYSFYANLGVWVETCVRVKVATSTVAVTVAVRFTERTAIVERVVARMIVATELAEIAQQLGISEATSKSQLSRAKGTLRKLLEEVV